MNRDPIIHELLAEIRTAYATDPANAPQVIDALLKTRLAGQPVIEGRAILSKILERLAPDEPSAEATADKAVLTRMFSLLLGREVTTDDLSSAQMLERASQSLNTIFDALNQLIGVIDKTLSGKEDRGEQTIRQFIGSHLGGQDQTESLEAYLGRISEAFLTTQEAFKKAAQTKVAQILQTLDPGKIAAERSGGLKFGPLRKAEDYDILKEKIDRIQRWFDSGRFMDDYLREFEKNCQGFNRQ
jgi:hypothetical protein